MRSDSLDEIGAHASDADLLATLPSDWELGAFRSRAPPPRFADLVPGTRYRIEARDTVTGAPELVRLTLNLAMAHLDAGASYLGQRLVYGGHTISLAFAQTVRALPSIVTVCGWRSCEHLAPVLVAAPVQPGQVPQGALVEQVPRVHVVQCAQVRIGELGEALGHGGVEPQTLLMIAPSSASFLSILA